MTDRRPVLLLTGASRGIGRASAGLFRAHGWRVLTISRTAPSENPEDYIAADLGDPVSVEAAIAITRTRLPDGRLDALVNNAGISPKNPQKGHLGVEDTDAEIWQRVLNTNLVAGALLCRGLMPQLLAARGAIVNVTSIAGMRVHPFASAAYAASKAGLAALTRELAAEFGARGVRANAVAPGEIATSILSPGTDDLVAREVPMHRLGTPQEVAETIVFLCSPAAAYINGAELPINGGQHT
jgi:NAD(P)-dependent dehydrogenase (short-subunit alcohol dehydrogenase family)